MQFQKVGENNFSMYYTSCLLPPAWCATKKKLNVHNRCVLRAVVLKLSSCFFSMQN